MFQLVYTSTATVPFTTEALRALLGRSRENNTALGVTGILAHIDGSFLQTLEGERQIVEQLYARISKDRRHSQVVTLLRREISERNFADWSMGFVDGTGRASALAGYRADSGFADLLGDTASIIKILHDFRHGRWRSLAD